MACCGVLAGWLSLFCSSLLDGLPHSTLVTLAYGKCSVVIFGFCFFGWWFVLWALRLVYRQDLFGIRVLQDQCKDYPPGGDVLLLNCSAASCSLVYVVFVR